MKKTTLLIFAMMAFAFSANAQLASGTFFAGGTVSYQSSSRSVKVGNTTSDDWKSSTLVISPSAGYFIMDRTAVGLMTSFTNDKFINYMGNGDKTTTIDRPVNVSIFVRRFFMINEGFGFFAGLNVGGDFGNSTTEEYDLSDNETTITESSMSGFGANLNAGAIWFPAPHIGIEAGVGIVGYNTLTTTQKNTTPEVSSKEDGFVFGVSSMKLNFGFHYYFF